MKREKMIIIRISQEELREIYDRMQILGIDNLSNYLRLMGRKGIINTIDMSGFDEVVRLMSISSNNLNQYAKKANETGNIYVKEINKLSEQFEEIYGVLKELLNRFSTL